MYIIKINNSTVKVFLLKKLFKYYDLYKFNLRYFYSLIYIIKYWELNKSILLMKLIFWKKENSLFKKRFKFIKNYFFYFLKRYRFKKKKTFKLNSYSSYYVNHMVINKSNRTKKKRRLVDLKKKLFYNILESRKIINFFLLNNKKSKNVTKFIYKLKHKSNLLLYKKLHLLLFFVILSSKFSYSLNDFRYMILNKFIYLNKNPIKSYYISLKKNDLIEFVITKYYLLYLVYKKNNLTMALRRYKWRKIRKLKYNFSKLNKNRFFNSKYFKNFIYYFHKISKCYEIDYYLLKIIIVKDPILLTFNNWWKKFLSFYLLKLYNWKFLI